LNWRVPTEVKVVENVMVVVFDAPNVAVPVGTVAGVQLAAVFQSPLVGFRSLVALPPRLVSLVRTRTGVTTNRAKRSDRLWRANAQQ